MTTPGFETYTFANGKLDVLDRAFPSYLSAWDERSDRWGFYMADDLATHYGYCHQGRARLTLNQGEPGQTMWTLKEGMYFSVPGRFAIEGGRGIIMSREHTQGFFQIGGPVEHQGRLRYIDGCTDSLLIPPVRKGDACLNLLYFPPGIDQTAHTHPSDRIGIILSGLGVCVTWETLQNVKPVGAAAKPVTTELRPGTIFAIRTGCLHKFKTESADMRVLAFHPDSDFGPTDEDHPMVNRTMVDGVPASRIDAIRTR